jgi:predicted Zn-dependent peptidase
MWILKSAVVAAAFMAAAALTPASAQPVEGKTPKGISYRFQRALEGEKVAVYFGWRHGAADEAREQALLHYVTWGMTFGAGGESKDTIDRKLRELQATWGIYSPIERTVGGYTTFDRPKMDQMASLLAQIVQKPNYTAKDLDDRYKKVLSPFRQKFNGEPLNQIQFVQFALNLPDFGDRSRWSPLNEAGIKPPSRELLTELHHATLGRNNLVVSVAGNLTEGDAGSFIDRVFGALPEVPDPPPLQEPAYKALNKVIKIERNVPQVYVRLYGVMERDEDPVKTAAQTIALRAFGEGNESSLYRALREELGAAYSTNAGTFAISPHLNLMVATVQLDPEKAVAAIERLREEYGKLLENGVDAGRVKREVDRILTPNDQPGVAARVAANNMFLAMRGLPANTPVELRKAYNTVPTEQINETIMETMPKTTTLVVMAPASVTLKADCTIKSYTDAAKCGF